MKRGFLACLLVLLGNFGLAQVGINTDAPHPSSALDMSKVIDKGVLTPKVALTGERDKTTIVTLKKD